MMYLEDLRQDYRWIWTLTESFRGSTHSSSHTWKDWRSCEVITEILISHFWIMNTKYCKWSREMPPTHWVILFCWVEVQIWSSQLNHKYRRAFLLRVFPQYIIRTCGWYGLGNHAQKSLPCFSRALSLWRQSFLSRCRELHVNLTRHDCLNFLLHPSSLWIFSPKYFVLKHCILQTNVQSPNFDTVNDSSLYGEYSMVLARTLETFVESSVTCILTFKLEVIWEKGCLHRLCNNRDWTSWRGGVWLWEVVQHFRGRSEEMAS
jgi:hypothetical protein